MKTRKDLMFPLRVLISIFLFIIVFVTIFQVGARFIFNSPFIWSDELARFLLIWMVLLGAAIVSYDGEHIGVKIFQEKMSPGIELVTKMIIRVIIVFTLVLTFYSSIELVAISHSQTSGALEIPFSFWRGSATVGRALMIITTIIRSFFDIVDYRRVKH